MLKVGFGENVIGISGRHLEHCYLLLLQMFIADSSFGKLGNWKALICGAYEGAKWPIREQRFEDKCYTSQLKNN